MKEIACSVYELGDVPKTAGISVHTNTLKYTQRDGKKKYTVKKYTNTQIHWNTQRNTH